MANSSGHETEIKLRVESLDDTRSKLDALGFRVVKERVFESNTVFDNAARDLRARRLLLRVREAGALCTLTFKGPAVPGKHKSREELELTLSDGAAFGQILERLGYSAGFRYEKYRTEFQRDGAPGIVTLDETPIGTFMELEGAPDWIDSAAAELGYGEAGYLTDSYFGLYAEYRKSRGMEIENMVFGDRQ